MWPFTRKSKQINPGPINEDWCVGDLAECICGEGWCDKNGPTPGLNKGDVFKVLSVSASCAWDGKDYWWLSLNGVHGIFGAHAFRKVPPLNSAATAKFSAQIKALKPKRVKV